MKYLLLLSLFLHSAFALTIETNSADTLHETEIDALIKMDAELGTQAEEYRKIIQEKKEHPTQKEQKKAEKKAVQAKPTQNTEEKPFFLIGIGGALKSGEPHDGRAPDYDDWTSESEPGYKGLNGDILLWHPVLKCAFEISSMGIRVDAEALERQLKIAGKEDRKDLLFHSKLLKDELPLSIGGGIGQSRLCMFFLRKAHIGEVQSSLWPEEMLKECREHDVFIL